MSESKGPVWKEWAEKIFQYGRYLLPWVLLAAVWRYFQRKLWFADRTIEQKDLEVKHHENKELVKNHNDRLSDQQLVDEVLSEGSEYLGDEPEDSGES